MARTEHVEHAVAAQVAIDSVLSGEGLDVTDRVLRSTHEERRFGLAEQALQDQKFVAHDVASASG